ncbi:Arginyl-tRNA--protein transferase 1 [Tulasnella sp. 403]|nr:Arginyl-tRNA--protein transferase 1 [Tulasnella sp. 403]
MAACDIDDLISAFNHNANISQEAIDLAALQAQLSASLMQFNGPCPTTPTMSTMQLAPASDAYSSSSASTSHSPATTSSSPQQRIPDSTRAGNEALNFKSSRSQRKVVYRFNRFLRGESEAKINATHDDSKRAPGAMDVDANPSPPAPQSPPSGSSGTVNPPSKSPRRRNQKNNGVQSAPHGQASSKLTDEAVTTSPATKDKSKDNNATTFSLIEEIHSVDARFVPESVKLAHHWEVTLEFSAYSQEKFDLFCKYQDVIHNEPEKQEDGFARFLCVSPIPGNLDIPYTSPDVPQHLPKKYGSYHQMYRLDGELIAMGVIDILPNCVSSVYLMYDPTWEAYSLGKLSALTEIALAQEMAQYGAPGMAYTYMGFYVHVCPKMRYKGDYGPSYLLDPVGVGA